MFKWLAKLFAPTTFEVERSQHDDTPYPKEIEVEGLLFKRTRRTEDEGFRYWDYYCPKCGDKLVDGPCGGSAINACCCKCQVNYGCLPGFDNPCHNF